MLNWGYKSDHSNCVFYKQKKNKKSLECRAHLSALSLEDFGNKEFVCGKRLLIKMKNQRKENF